ncbi:MAG: hypothetical protein CBD36_002680 [Candidatus Puniceispirillum sp. TMED176]|nr:MAG: hypothetical protein CBD36_002680 [Candidatus Puniceispirillum sp. TMED176]RZO30941.1 MAG: hypothetical protein EVA90_01130 [SAR116 cluster bacterium]
MARVSMMAARIGGAMGGAALICLAPVPAAAHATGQSFIALLPTGPYMAVGVIIVALSILLFWFLPHRSVGRLLPSRDLGPIAAPPLFRAVSSFVFFLLFCWLLSRGFSGTRDPLENPLVLGFWVVFWMASPMVQGFLFDLWGWMSPWRWLVAPLSAAVPRPPLALPPRLGVWPAVLLLLAFSMFTLADPAPDDPARLASVGFAYSAVTITGMVLCGPGRWLRQVEIFSVVMAHFGRLAPLARRGRRVRVGWPGWQLAHGARGARGIPVFILVLLGTGSFDGFNETFVWLDLIGVNPLAFPGRSAVVMPVVGGLVAANLLLVSLFTALLFTGDRLVAGPGRVGDLLAVFAPTILPIALAYHAAHYLPSLLVNGQYVLVALNDPFGSGGDWLGLEGFHVTTGFFKHRESMRLIWLSQAAIIVFGHVLAVILAHANAAQAYGGIRRAFTAGLPLAMFMILYTWLGLWLLAAPKGG